MKKIAKIILVIIFIIAASYGAWYYSNLPLELNVTKIQKQDAELYFIEEGLVTLSRELDVYSTVAGEINSLNVSEGQYVNKGDVICVIDSSDYRYKIMELESSISAYSAQMSNLDSEERLKKDELVTNRQSLEAELLALDVQENVSSVSIEEQLRLQNIIIEQNQNELETAQEDFKKTQVLYDNGIISESEYLEEKNNITNLESILEQSTKQLSVIENSNPQSSKEYFEASKQIIEVQIAGINDRIEKSYTSDMKSYYAALIEGNRANISSLNKSIADCTITSPYSGIIEKLQIKDINIVTIQNPLLTLRPDEKNLIEVYVNTQDIDEIKVGQSVELTLKRRIDDKKYVGTVKEISDEAEIKISPLGVEERKVKVTIVSDEPNDVFKNGYDVSVKFIYFNEKDKILVPKTALFEEDKKDMVWLINDGVLEKREVKKGIELRTDTIIEEGLSENTEIITDANTDNLSVGKKALGIKEND